MRGLFVTGVIGVAIALVSCQASAPKISIVGEWELTNNVPPDSSWKCTYEFTDKLFISSCTNAPYAEKFGREIRKSRTVSDYELTENNRILFKNVNGTKSLYEMELTGDILIVHDNTSSSQEPNQYKRIKTKKQR